MKNQTLSLRLDPKTRFVLEFVAKVKSQSITTVVEEAVRSAGDSAVVGGDSNFDEPRSWRAFWDVSEGVRALKMLADRDIPSSYEDDELRDFVLFHLAFFTQSGNLDDPDRINVHVLWPKIDDFLGAWRDAKKSRPFEVGETMSDALRDADVDPPAWPPKKSTAKVKKGSYAEDIDDEIPF